MFAAGNIGFPVEIRQVVAQRLSMTPVQNTPIDFIAYNPDGTVVLLAEAKNRRGTSESWAAKFRRNMLAHGILPRAQYFLIATPERIYGWKQG